MATKTKSITLLISEADIAELKTASQEVRESLSNYVRKAALQRAGVILQDFEKGSNCTVE